MFLSIRSIRAVLGASAISAALCIASPAMASSGNVRMGAISPGAAVSLNPQPIPPGHTDEELGPIRPDEAESLNPQPIPPGHGVEDELGH